jgi:hypothetical protein
MQVVFNKQIVHRRIRNLKSKQRLFNVAHASVTQGVTPSIPAFSLAAGIRVGWADVIGARRNVRSSQIFVNFDSMNTEPSLGYLRFSVQSQ